MWTLFWDMHSGGGSKEKWTMIYIEAPEDELILDSQMPEEYIPEGMYVGLR